MSEDVNKWSRQELISEVNHCHREQTEMINDISRLTKQVAELTARAEQAEAREKVALGEAIASIYFNDRSDYLPALWTIVRQLNPEAAILLENDESAAYCKYAENRNEALAGDGEGNKP